MRLFFLFLSILLISCNTKKAHNKNLVLPDFFEPFNWQVANNSDTFYLFFSPVHDSLVEVFEYKIVNGDSVNTQKDSIGFLNDSLRWKFNNNIYNIIAVGSNKIALEDQNIQYNLQKISDSLMVLGSKNDSFYFRRTLPISTFLVRKKDDYLKGSSGADSAEVLPRKVKKAN
jgi:hypothetical protein